jgi:ribonuclease P protein component
VTYLAAPAGRADVRVAFQVGKASGGAVVRNRIRRRLRAGLRELHQRGALPAGTYLLGGRATLATQPWPALRDDLADAVATATDGSEPGPAR